ncbi:MAG: plastocyanin/azurin family copper-binding protein [Lutibacter sp.]|jgi:plastocyanin
MKAFNFIKNGIFFLLPILLLVYSCDSKPSYIPQAHVVEIKDMKFQPAELNVHKGDTVIWINKDIVAHDVTEDNKAWASPPLTTDAIWKNVITKSDSYYCSIHVVMKGKLTVEE